MPCVGGQKTGSFYQRRGEGIRMRQDREAIQAIRCFLLDMDGTIYLGRFQAHRGHAWIFAGSQAKRPQGAVFDQQFLQKRGDIPSQAVPNGH